MKRINNLLAGGVLLLNLSLFITVSCKGKAAVSSAEDRKPEIIDTVKQKAALEKIIGLLPPDRVSRNGQINQAGGRVSFLDDTFKDWVTRTGELPPDFDRMPSIPFLPDPLILDEGGLNIPVRTKAQWKEKREWIKNQLEYYITGTCPPDPGNLEAEVLSEKKDGVTTLRMIRLSFGPGHQARLTLELVSIPPGNGPFPVFITQWNHREWAQVAVRRGYVGCIYSGADSNDDTEKYSEIWAGQYDFTRLRRRAWGASRAIDYLYTLPFVDKDKIGITGHSRNGDVSYLAAAFDERITAVIPSSGTGMEVPWRYSSLKYDIEDLAREASAFPSWFHPRLRFFVGKEHKLPVDNNLYMALIAPRGLMMSTALNEGAGNPWASEQVYFNARKVYQFLGAEDHLVIRLRDGLHGICARDMEDYIDFFDYVFKRNGHKIDNRLVCNYSFERWFELSREKINPGEYPVKGLDDIDTDGQNNKITSIEGWGKKKSDILLNIHRIMGDEPPGVTNPGPGRFIKGGNGESSFGTFLVRPQPTERMGMMAVSPYTGFGDQLFGYLYYPGDEKGNLKNEKSPVIIYLHEYDYSKGFNSYSQVELLFQSIIDRGYAVFSYDMLGFGNRIEEGTRFYERYPQWSKLGKMVVDVKGAVDALKNLDFIDGEKIYVAGYSLGAMVGLYAAALDERIAGVVSVAGFTPMRLNTLDRGTEGIKAYSHLHGLLPRLGFFIGNESRIPYDYHEILACIAPRPVLVIAPVMDKDAHIEDVRKSVYQAGKIYALYSSSGQIQIYSPDDYNRFSNEMREKMYEWLEVRQAKSDIR